MFIQYAIFLVIKFCREREPQILDYQTQQYKVLPALACTYAFHITSTFLIKTYLEIESEIADGKTERLAEVSNSS